MRALPVLLLLAPSLALADDTDEPEVRYLEETNLDFTEGLELQGQILKPSVRLTIQRMETSFNPLIKLRRDFDRELLASAVEVP